MVALLFTLLAPGFVEGQNSLGTGEPVWLAYRPVNAAAVFPGGVPDSVVTLGHSALKESASRGLILGWRGMLQREHPIVTGASSRLKRTVVIGTEDEINARHPSPNDHKPLATEAYKLYRLGMFSLLKAVGNEASSTERSRFSVQSPNNIRWQS